MLKLRSDRSLIYKSSVLAVVLHVAYILFTYYSSLTFCFYQVKLNLRSKRSVIFQFKKYWGIQFHWQFWTMNSCFWLVNILLRKFDTSSKKEMKIIKTNFMMKKMAKN